MMAPQDKKSWCPPFGKEIMACKALKVHVEANQGLVWRSRWLTFRRQFFEVSIVLKDDAQSVIGLGKT
jgi:hypothetical protein